jgi:uncharacterized protein HemY
LLGKAYFNKKEFKKAVETFKKSLLEKRTASARKLKLKAEKMLKAQEEEQMLDPEESYRLNEEGKVLFHNGD